MSLSRFLIVFWVYKNLFLWRKKYCLAWFGIYFFTGLITLLVLHRDCVILIPQILTVWFGPPDPRYPNCYNGFFHLLCHTIFNTKNLRSTREIDLTLSQTSLALITWQRPSYIKKFRHVLHHVCYLICFEKFSNNTHRAKVAGLSVESVTCVLRQFLVLKIGRHSNKESNCNNWNT